MPSQEIDRLNLKVGVTATPKAIKNIDALTASLSKLDAMLTKVSAHDGISGLVDGSGSKKSGGGGKKGSTKTPKKNKTPSFSKMFGLAKMGATIHMARKLGRVVASIAQAGSDYTETLNLWETAMHGNLDVATKFVDKMNEAYGVSEKTLMNAQATFKNMLGSLGQISDETAYRLSEGVTQMALDYASLYNQTFEQAMYKFQAALAGQVRPIRSVSGFDITETTLFQLYQSLGGEKTMRQLNRTEKQLLSIYAIFQQMERSGTVGDLDKTMESYANQSRVASEMFKEVVQYSGILLTHSIQQAGILQKVNGFLIFLGDVLKAVAEEYGAIQHFGDPFEATTDGALAAQKATDELQGKLLDFDKFRALDSSGDKDIGIDETLLKALSSYDSILEGAGMEAKKIADSLKTISGLFNEDGTFNPDRLKEIETALENIGVFIAAIIGYKFAKYITTIGTAFSVSGGSVILFATAVVLLHNGIKNLMNAWGNMSAFEQAISVITGLTAAIVGMYVAINSFGMTPLGALAVGTALAGIIFSVQAGIKKGQISLFADGGLPDKGSLFIAGEAGAELVTNMGGGQSGVMNMEQLENAVARGMYVGLSSVNLQDDRPIYVSIDGQSFFTASRDIYKRNGYDVSRIK